MGRRTVNAELVRDDGADDEESIVARLDLAKRAARSSPRSLAEYRRERRLGLLRLAVLDLCSRKIARRLDAHAATFVLPRLMGPIEVRGFLRLDRVEARSLALSETRNREGRPVAVATITTTAWRPQWGRYASVEALRALAVGEGLVRRTGARSLSARSLQVLVHDRLRLIPLARTRGAPRFLSAEDHALISLLGGGWPEIRITKTTTASDVLRAEVAAFDQATKRHERVPPAVPVFDDFDGTDEKTIRWEVPRLSRGKRGVVSAKR